MHAVRRRRSVTHEDFFFFQMQSETFPRSFSSLHCRGHFIQMTMELYLVDFVISFMHFILTLLRLLYAFLRSLYFLRGETFSLVFWWGRRYTSLPFKLFLLKYSALHLTYNLKCNRIEALDFSLITIKAVFLSLISFPMLVKFSLVLINGINKLYIFRSVINATYH
jgi:hypothetical protein